MKKIVLKKYDSLGFVEALIALTVSGIVGLVLMEISASTLNELRKLDMQDEIAQHAVSTSVNLQKIAIEDMTREDKVLEDLIVNSCYGFNIEDASVNASSSGYTREDFAENSLIPVEGQVEEELEYFRYFCVKAKDDKKMLVEVVVGSNRVNGLATTDNDVKDYSYFAIINR